MSIFDIFKKKKKESSCFDPTRETYSHYIGRIGEDKACEFLMNKGLTVRARNYRFGKYEIDIIAESLDRIVFVEVKTRTYDDLEHQYFGRPYLAIDKEKKHNTVSCAYAYLRREKCKKPPRFDAIEVYLQKTDKNAPECRVLKIEHIESAF